MFLPPPHPRHSAHPAHQVDDNIPLRVMLLLMDEVFDLKEKNQWLRRNIKNLLQQLIRATYGDTINRSEVDAQRATPAPLGQRETEMETHVYCRGLLEPEGRRRC